MAVEEARILQIGVSPKDDVTTSCEVFKVLLPRSDPSPVECFERIYF